MENIPLLENVHRNADTEPDFLQIVPLGKTGAGKSSFANTLFGEKDWFRVGHFGDSETKVALSQTKEVNGRKLRLIDSPGLFDTKENNTEISSEHLMFLLDCAPGIHAFLILLKVERFTMQEKGVIDSILKPFGKNALKYSTVVFTHGDQLPDGMKIEDWVKHNDGLKNLVQKCGGRVHVFDNKYWNNNEDPYRNNQVQRDNLLKTIEETVTNNGGGCYTNETLLAFEREIQQAMSDINETSPGDDPNTVQEKAKKMAQEKIWPKIKHVTVGSVLGLLVGGATLGTLSIVLIPSATAGAVVAGAAAAVSGVVGGLTGQIIKMNIKREEEKQDKKDN